jgi:hypothetical protein
MLVTMFVSNIPVNSVREINFFVMVSVMIMLMEYHLEY